MFEQWLRKFPVFVAFCMAWLCQVGVVHAEQVFTYDNDDQVVGAAVSKPRFNKATVEKTMQYCSKVSAELSSSTQDALDHWTSRNIWSIDAASRLFSDIEKKYLASGQVDPQEWEQTVKMMDAQVDVTSDLLVRQLEVLTLEKYKARMCQEYVAAVNAGKFDLRPTDDDPRIYALLSKYRK